MASQLIIFLDDGGVMNDNSLRASQWQRLVGEYFIPLLGGTSEAWIEANRTVTNDLFDAENWRKRLQAASDYASFDHAYQFDWLKGMCEYLRIPPPPEEECVRLARRATAYITPRVHAAFPGAVDAIRMMHSEGYCCTRPPAHLQSTWQASSKAWVCVIVLVGSMAPTWLIHSGGARVL